jgi:hypothetical protein
MITPPPDGDGFTPPPKKLTKKDIERENAMNRFYGFLTQFPDTSSTKTTGRPNEVMKYTEARLARAEEKRKRRAKRKRWENLTDLRRRYESGLTR